MRRGLPGCVASLALLLATGARAETPAGAYTITVSGDDAPYLPSGTVDIPDNHCPFGTVCVSNTVGTDAHGAITGTGRVKFLRDAIDLVLDVQFSGQASGTTAKPKARLRMLGEGTITGGDQSLDAHATADVPCAFIPAPEGVPSTEDHMFCTGKLQVCVFLLGAQLDCVRIPFGVATRLARAPFDLALDLATDAKHRVSGSAEMQVGEEDPIACDVSGKFAARADSTKARLLCGEGDARTKLALKKVVLADGVPESGTLVFEVAGQRGKADLAPTPPPAAASGN